MKLWVFVFFWCCDSWFSHTNDRRMVCVVIWLVQRFQAQKSHSTPTKASPSSSSSSSTAIATQRYATMCSSGPLRITVIVTRWWLREIVGYVGMYRKNREKKPLRFLFVIRISYETDGVRFPFRGERFTAGKCDRRRALKVFCKKQPTKKSYFRNPFVFGHKSRLTARISEENGWARARTRAERTRETSVERRKPDAHAIE